MNKRAKHLLAKAAREHDPNKARTDAETAQKIIDNLFPEQRDFVLDRSRRRAALCPRRSGKSFVSLAAAIYQCLTRPESKVLIIAKVRRQVKGVYWGDLKKFNKQYQLKGKPRANELNFEFPNGSMIDFTGADTQEEIDKFRGQGYDLVIIDEGKSYSPTLLQELIEEIIMPALMDRKGRLIMIGTPGAVLSGLFYDVTTAQPLMDPTTRQPVRDENGELVHYVRKWQDRDTWEGTYLWSLHKWTTRDNIKCPWIWEEVLQLKKETGWSDQHPTWLREYMGEWVPDDNAMVYSYHKANETGQCDWEPDYNKPDFGLPPEHEWRYLLGVDLGYRDDTAFVIAAWSETHPALHYIHAEKHGKLNVEQLANKLKGLERQFNISFDARIADTGNLAVMITQTLSQVYGIPLIAAKKTEKHVHIKLLNADMEAGRIKVPPRSALAEEWATLAWDNSDPVASAFRKKEDPRLDNHAADAALYLWRYAYHHWQKTQEVEITPGSEDWWKQREAEHEQKLIEEQNAGDEEPWRKYSRTSWTRTRKLKRW